MKFSDANSSYEYIPEWVKYMLMFGYRWSKSDGFKRRIALISMPCDSAGAGLITLGALLKYLEDPFANDLAAHSIRVQNECEPLVHPRYPKKRFRYIGKNEDDQDIMQEIISSRKTSFNGPAQHTLHIKDVGFEGEPFPEVSDGNELPYRFIYENITGSDGVILQDNLRKTYSAVCLATRKSGMSMTRLIMESIVFHLGSISASLDQLIAIHEWSREKISRTSLYNSRTEEMDRQSVVPKLIVADGDGAFLDAIDKPLFLKSDFIAVIDRTTQRYRLEDIMNKMENMTSRYTREERIPDELQACPTGIHLAIWKKL